MSAGYPASTSVGSGTAGNATASSTISATPNGTTVPGDLVILVAYGLHATLDTADFTLAKDTVDGWRILSSGWDTTTHRGILVAGLIARRPGTGTPPYTGITLPGTCDWRAQSHSFRTNPAYRFHLGGATRDNGWFFSAASSTTNSAPEILQPYPQCLDVMARGVNNDGTTRTSGVITITGYTVTERFDTGGTAPNINVYLNTRECANSVQNPLVSGTISAAVTNHAGVRVMIPIIAADTFLTSTTRRNRRLV